MKKENRAIEREPRSVFGEIIFGKQVYLEGEKDIKRINVMTRIRKDVVDILDALVLLGAFNSRSEAVASYTEHSILSKRAGYERLKKRAQELGIMRESAMDLALEEFKDE
jgi:hypothetical protein